MMNNKKLRTLLLGAIVLGSAPAYAQVVDGDYDPQGINEEGPKNVRVMLEWIETSQEMVTELLAEEAKGSNHTELRAKVAELIKAKKAFVFETQMMTTRPGSPARVESIREEIYPTEYDPSELPNEVKVDSDGEETANFPTTNVTAPTATAFETRNLGGTFECDPTISQDGQIIDLQMTPEIVKKVVTYVFGTFDDGRAKADIEMPIFYTERVKTQISLQRGQPTLLALLTPPDENGQPDRSRKHMVFVRADVLVVGKK